MSYVSPTSAAEATDRAKERRTRLTLDDALAPSAGLNASGALAACPSTPRPQWPTTAYPDGRQLDENRPLRSPSCPRRQRAPVAVPVYPSVTSALWAENAANTSSSSG